MVDLRAYGLAHALSVPDGARVGRVRTQHRIDWEMVTAAGDVRAPLPNRKAERPGVGDWVVLADDVDVITAVLPRKNALVRRAAGLREEPQQLAANVDACFVLVPLSGPPNVKRIERYLALVLDGGSVPVVVLTKSDLCASIDEAIASVRTVSGDAAVHAISAQTGQGMAALEPYFSNDATVALLGASGVGKSSLVNAWMGEEVLDIAAVREKDQKGRHTTTRRELFVRPAGGVVIDTPGTREVGLWDADEGVDDAFVEIVSLAAGCRFGDCAHTVEPGCAVRAAVARGELEAERVERYLRVRAGTASRAARVGRAKRR
ncbi:MAG: ribosome small subunit-dependent GTPase A [Myxococcales bacterium]|nr:ribosome small subunit-dependent GTPase A [Myxococcales bacterium]